MRTNHCTINLWWYWTLYNAMLYFHILPESDRFVLLCIYHTFAAMSLYLGLSMFEFLSLYGFIWYTSFELSQGFFSRPTFVHFNHRPFFSQESDNQTQCSMSITGSDVSDSVTFSHAKSPGLGPRNNSSDDFECFDSPRSRSSCFSFTHEAGKAVDSCDVHQYLRSFSRVISKERSNYSADDYAIQKMSGNILTDMVAFKNRIEYGGLVLCNIRTFWELTEQTVPDGKRTNVTITM
jgi:hypothetical protein